MGYPREDGSTAHLPRHARLRSQIARFHRPPNPASPARRYRCKDPDVVHAPDVAWIAADRGRPVPGEYFRGAPNLAVEIVSPSDRDADVAEKVADWLAAGSQRVWVVRPRQRAVTVHRPNGDAHTYAYTETLDSDDAGFPVSGFELSLAAIFP